MEQVSLQSHSTLRHVRLQAPIFAEPVGCCGVLRFLHVLPSPAHARTVGNIIYISSAPQCLDAPETTCRALRVEPTAQRQFQYLCRWFAAPAHATLQQRCSQSDQLDDHSLVPLAFGRMGRCHRGLVSGGHSHAGANVARALSTQRRRYVVRTDDHAIADRPGHAGAAGRCHECSATLGLFRAGHPCAACNSADVRFGRNKACWPPLAVLASGSTEKGRAPQVMSVPANGCHHPSGEVSSYACGQGRGCDRSNVGFPATSGLAAPKRHGRAARHEHAHIAGVSPQ
jgi:hypothetical protein